jgi:hypothetical protein
MNASFDCNPACNLNNHDNQTSSTKMPCFLPSNPTKVLSVSESVSLPPHQHPTKRKRINVSKQPPKTLTNVPRTPIEMRALIYRIQMLCQRIIPSETPTKDEITLLVHAAEDAFKALLTDEAAIDQAQGFTFPPDVTAHDTRIFEATGWDFDALVATRIAELPTDRLNEPTIRRLVDPTDEDIERLIDISKGVPVLVSPDFTPNEDPPALRQRYLHLHAPMNKEVYKRYRQGKTIILPLDLLPKIPRAHFSSLHVKMEPEKLRLLADSSNAPPDTHALNSDSVHAQAIARYGPIKHPTIDEMIIMADVFLQAHAHEEVELYKVDLASAFSLFSIHPRDVRKLGYQLTDNLLQFELTGSFGNTQWPIVFNVITKILRRETNKRLRDGVNEMYVDDICGISTAANVTTNIDMITAYVEELCGRGAIAATKTVHSNTELEWIGYDVHVKERVVRMSRRNRLKTIRIFFGLQENVSLTVLDVMRAASYAYRYSKICPVMTPYSGHLYNVICWRDTKYLHAQIPQADITAECRIAIMIWRCVLVIMELRREDQRFYRTFTSFKPLPASTYHIQFDASLQGAGIIISKSANPIWTHADVIKVITFQFTYDHQHEQYHSSYQNTMEFIAAVVGMAYAAKLGARNCAIKLYGDSATALRWAETWKFKAGRSTNAAVAYVAIGLQHHLRFDETVFVRGADNHLCDGLSRGTHPRDLGYEPHHYDEEIDGTIAHLLAICTPSTNPVDEFDFIDRWQAATEVAASLGDL